MTILRSTPQGQTECPKCYRVWDQDEKMYAGDECPFCDKEPETKETPAGNVHDFSNYRNREDWEQTIAANADYFTASRFLGRANYATVEAPSLEEARKEAQKLLEQYGGTIMIYAIAQGHSAHVENYPSKPKPGSI